MGNRDKVEIIAPHELRQRIEQFRQLTAPRPAVAPEPEGRWAAWANAVRMAAM